MTKAEHDAYYKKHGKYHLSDPRNPMNRPATNAGGSSKVYDEKLHKQVDPSYKYTGGKMKVDPMYAKSGCKVYNNR